MSSDRVTFLRLWGLGILGLLALLPMKIARWPQTLIDQYSLPVLISLDVAVNGIVFAGPLIYFGLRLAKKMRLELWNRGRWRDTVALGLFLGFLLRFADAIFFLPKLPQVAAVNIPVWQGVLASFYGGITEELTMRLGIMTIFAWLFRRSVRVFWIANILTAILFGALHLPAASSSFALTSFLVYRILLLNGIASAIFGYLYWYQGLGAAIVSHFMADIILHVF